MTLSGPVAGKHRPSEHQMWVFVSHSDLLATVSESHSALYYVVITWQYNPPISQFNSPFNEFTSVWSMFVCTIWGKLRPVYATFIHVIHVIVTYYINILLVNIVGNLFFHIIIVITYYITHNRLYKGYIYSYISNHIWRTDDLIKTTVVNASELMLKQSILSILPLL